MLKFVDVHTECAVWRPATKFLFALLAQRTAESSISHQRMPTYEDHMRFVDSRPYREWFIVFIEEEPIGSVYLTRQNEIGVFISNNMQHYGYGTAALRMLMDRHPGERFLANINPGNERSIELFKKLGFGLLQVTYAMTPKC